MSEFEEVGKWSWEVQVEQQARIDGLQKQMDEALFKMRQLSLVLRDDIDGYKDPVQLCQSEGVEMCVKILEEVLRVTSE